MSPRALFLLAFAVCGSLGLPSDVTPSSSRSLLLRRAEGSPHPHTRIQRSASESPKEKLKIYELNVESNVEYRFATTLISSRVANTANESQEAVFSVTIPDNAFISGFKMQVEDKVYEAYVKEKSEAKREYTEAVSRGQSAGHVAMSARDSNRFTISVNVEPTHKVTFNLTYDELLIRKLGTYNLAINLDPGQPVRRMTVDVHIKESRNITVLRVPELRSGNEVDADENTKANSLATIERVSATEAHVSFSPSLEQQKSLGHIGQPDAKKSLKGQFVVQYDVDRDVQTGEILVNNGYFVHFYAPKHLQPLHKHAIFVLDVSGSMRSRKIEQLKEAMLTILDELNEGDYFNIIEFSNGVKVWNLDNMDASTKVAGPHCYRHECETNDTPTPAFPVTPSYIAQAKTHVRNMEATGGTNIHDALKTAINVSHVGLKGVTTSPTNEKHAPIIFFLTDGQPTTTGTDQIMNTVREINQDPQASLFSLAFGNDADLGFLRKLSLTNAGFARKIYEASDAALQLRDFYRQIASPLLANVTFQYQPDTVLVNTTTKHRFPNLFAGSEIVIAGRIRNKLHYEDDSDLFEGDILGESKSGATTTRLNLRPFRVPFMAPKNNTVTQIEKLWAYLTIKQLLEAEELQNSVYTEDGNTYNTSSSPKQKALELALRYSFVTSLTSLVVVKPNASLEADVTAVKEGEEDRRPTYRTTSLRGPVGAPQQLSSGYASSSSYAQPHHRVLVGAPKGHHPSRNHQTSLPHTTTTATATSSEALSLIPMDELEWLGEIREGLDVTLPFGVNGANQTYQLDVAAQPQSTSPPCVTPTGGQGHCQHLSTCSLSVFKHDIQVYQGYFCPVNTHFAGVCCPNGLLPSLTTPSA